MLDGNSKLKICVKRGGDADELSTFKCTFPVIVSVQEYLQTNGDDKSGVHLSALLRFDFILTNVIYNTVAIMVLTDTSDDECTIAKFTTCAL
jgi:hypothetical protein